MRPFRAAKVAALFLVVNGVVLSADRMPALVLQAQYVALGYDLGDRFLSESDAIGDPDRVTPEDRKALREVRDLLEKWDRYVVTRRPGDAQLLIAVRAGRRGRVGGSVYIGGGGTRPGPLGGSSAFELSSRGDVLSVYEGSGGGLGVPLWRGQRRDGFSGPSPTLIEQFRTEVEGAAKKP
jgi:hypothetical protein